MAGLGLRGFGLRAGVPGVLWVLMLAILGSGTPGRAPSVNQETVNALRELLKGRVSKATPMKLRGGHEMMLRGGDSAELLRTHGRDREAKDNHEGVKDRREELRREELTREDNEDVAREEVERETWEDRMASSLSDSVLDNDDSTFSMSAASVEPQTRPGRRYLRGDTVLSARSGSRSAASSRTTSPMDVRDEDGEDSVSIPYWGLMDKLNHAHLVATRKGCGLPVDGLEQAAEEDFLQGSGKHEAVPKGREAQTFVKHFSPRLSQRLPQHRPEVGEKTDLGLARARARLAEASSSMQQALAQDARVDENSVDEDFSEEEARKVRSELDKEPVIGPPEERSMMILNIPDHTREQHIIEFMSDYGPIERVFVHPLRSFAHVRFKSRDSLAFALQQPRTVFLGCNIEFKKTQLINPAQKRWKADSSMNGEFNDGILPKQKYEPNSRVLIEKPRRPDSKELHIPGFKSKFVRERVQYTWVDTDENGDLVMPPFLENTAVVHNLGTNCTLEQVKAFFGRCGSIVEGSVEVAVEGKTKFAQLQFSSYSSMQKACSLDGDIMQGREIRVRERGRTLPMVEDQINEAIIDTTKALEESLTCKRKVGGKSKR